MKIPLDLVEQIEKGDCVLFLGWSFPGNDSEEFSERFVARKLAERIRFPEPTLSLSEIAEYFQLERGPNELIRYTCDLIESFSHNIPGHYEQITNLPFNIIVTTTLDNFLKHKLREKGRQFISVIRDEETSFVEPDKLLLVQLFGDTDNKPSMVLTRDDYMTFFEDFPNISDLLKHYFSSKTLLFLGCDLNDSNFLRLYAYTNQRSKNYQKRAYAIVPSKTSLQERSWNKRNLTLLVASIDEFLTELVSNVSTSIVPIADPLAGVSMEDAFPIQASPYKFLDSFDETDAGIFYGRDIESIHIGRKLLSSKITILYGKSGYGKTSVIRAGLIPRISTKDYLVVYVRCAGDPLEAIKQNIITQILQLGHLSQENEARLIQLRNLSLPEFILKLKGLDARSLIIIIDQFEEFFISLGDMTKAKFEEELATSINSTLTDASFLLSLREDFLAELHELDSIRNILGNGYRLKALSEEQAIDAIAKPAEKFGITYEKDLVPKIIQDLTDNGAVDPAQLQITCDRVYNSLVHDKTIIDFKLYNDLGGVRQILAEYLDTILDSFGQRRREIAQRIMKSMVTSWFTRIPLKYSDALLELADINNWTVDDTDRLLQDLANARLVRRIADADEKAYELTHEHLILKIREWIDYEQIKVKEAQDLLRQEHNNWQRHKILMGLAALKLINSQREMLILNNDSKALLLAAATKFDFEYDYWLVTNKNNERAIDILFWLASSDNVDARVLSGIALGYLVDDPGRLDRIFQVLAEVTNPNTVRKIEQLEREGFVFVDGFRQQVDVLVKTRFTKDMVDVPGGSFTMGATENQIQTIIAEAKQDEIDIPPSFFDGQYPQRQEVSVVFRIDKYLVTNAQFAEFKKSHTFPNGHENHPATGVTWYEAKKYAAWLGKDLPTEIEWEKASRGTDERFFPWGNDWDPSRCSTRLSGYGGTTPVDAFPTGASPYGCLDMGGNVWEWTSTWLDEGKKQIVLKGGSWSKYGVLPWCFYRFNYETESGYANVGFRCILRSIEEDEGKE